MIDVALESRLWFLLMVDHRCCLAWDDVCWWHHGRAIRVLLVAGMRSDERGCWVTGPNTEAWCMRTFSEIRDSERRHESTLDLGATAPTGLDYAPTDAAPPATPSAAAPVPAGQAGGTPSPTRAA